MPKRNFQEKRDSARRTQEKPSTRNEELFESKRNHPVTYDNARKTIFEWIKQGRNYREIAQTPFNIIGWDRPKKFSISEISRIKNNPNAVNQTPEKYDQMDEEYNLIDEKKAEIFELLDKDVHPRKIVVRTKFNPEFVKETTVEYLELDNFSPQIIKKLIDISKEFNYKIQNSDQLKNLFWEALDSHKVWKNLYYYCVRCGKPVYLTPEKNNSWKEDVTIALNYLSENNWHPECDF